VPVWPRRNRFVTDIWLDAYSAGAIGNRDGLLEACDRDRCILRPRSVHGAPIVWLVYAPDRLPEACRNADILLAPRLRWVNCRDRMPGLILKRGDFERGGTHAIRFGRQQGQGAAAGLTFAVETARNQPGRPWEQWFAVPEPESKPVRDPAFPTRSPESGETPDYR
jgi:hypothetical protein